MQKTGGTTIQQVLDDNLADSRSVFPKHGGLGQALRRYPDLAGCWTFGFVRNPWARMVSWWSMIQGLHEKDPSHQLFRNQQMWRDVADYADFEIFVQHGPAGHRKLRKSQVSYLTSKQGRRTDFVGRTETFADDLRAVLARLDLPAVEIPQANRSSHGDYRDYYTDASRKHVAALFRADIAAFGYEF